MSSLQPAPGKHWLVDIHIIENRTALWEIKTCPYQCGVNVSDIKIANWNESRDGDVSTFNKDGKSAKVTLIQKGSPAVTGVLSLNYTDEDGIVHTVKGTIYLYLFLCLFGYLC